MNIIARFAVTSLLVAAIHLIPSIVVGQSPPSPEPRMAIAFSVNDLPVWTVNDAKEPCFDASILVSRIKNEIQPELWKSGRARLVQDAENESLILVAPQSEYTKLRNRISSLLAITRAFSEHDVNSRLKKNLKLAEMGGEQIMLFCTHADSMFYENFTNTRNENSELDQLLNKNYIVQCVPSMKAVELKEQGLGAPGEFGAGFAILSADGKSVAHKEFDSWDDTTVGSLTEFAQRNAKAFGDANILLNDGLLEAKNQGKKVLVQMGGPSCGPCILLTRYLRTHKQLIEKDFVHVKLDERMENADEIKKSYGSEFETIPWMVILSSDAKPLADGLTPKGNMAFPRAAFQQEHFRKMLESTCERLTDADIATLMDALPKSSDISPSTK